MHDGYAAYTNALPQSNHLYCWAHLLRFAHEETIFDPPDSQAAQLTQQLVRVYHLKNDGVVSRSQDLEARLRTELDQVLARSRRRVPQSTISKHGCGCNTRA